jgi:hypothetical protein
MLKLYRSASKPKLAIAVYSWAELLGWCAIPSIFILLVLDFYEQAGWVSFVMLSVLLLTTIALRRMCLSRCRSMMGSVGGEAQVSGGGGGEGGVRSGARSGARGGGHARRESLQERDGLLAVGGGREHATPSKISSGAFVELTTTMGGGNGCSDNDGSDRGARDVGL